MHTIPEIAVNDCRQPLHAADVGMQALHIEPLPLANCFITTNIVHKMAADLPLKIAVNDHMQSPHEADRGMQAFHEEDLGLAKKIGAPDIITKMAADPSVLLEDHDSWRTGNCHQCYMHGHMLQDYDDLPSVKEFLALNASTVTLPTVAVIPRPNVVSDSYWPAD